MSGTSLDGIDVALIRTDGEDIVERGPAMTFAYNDEQRSQLLEALGDARGIEHRDERPGNLAGTEQELTNGILMPLLHFLDTNPAEVDVIGFHGQTVIHRPEKKLTVQLGWAGRLPKAWQFPWSMTCGPLTWPQAGRAHPLFPSITGHSPEISLTVLSCLSILAGSRTSRQLIPKMRCWPSIQAPAMHCWMIGHQAI